jgi:hypothetical protein
VRRAKAGWTLDEVHDNFLNLFLLRFQLIQFTLNKILSNVSTFSVKWTVCFLYRKFYV